MNNKWYQSSTGSGDLSLTLKGIMMAFIPLIILAGSKMGFALTETGIMEVIGAILGAVSAVQIVVGMARKIVNAFRNR